MKRNQKSKGSKDPDRDMEFCLITEYFVEAPLFQSAPVKTILLKSRKHSLKTLPEQGFVEVKTRLLGASFPTRSFWHPTCGGV